MQAIETIEYKGHSINVFYDECAENPFKNWDCEPDLLVFMSGHGYRYDEHEYSEEYATGYLPELTRAQIKANLDEILELTAFETYLELSSSIGRYKFENDAVGMINTALHEEYENAAYADKFDIYAAVLGMQGIIALFGSVQGNRQGDYGYCLAIASSEFIKNSGANITKPDQLKGTIELYENYAFGNVYFYSIEGKLCSDSCGGFYGYNFDTNGLLEYARNSIDCAIDSARREHLNQVKQWIKSKVPLIYRNGSELA